ncbi:hypothetical protein KR093_004526 [Drosophila rubida]|uniref:Nucleolar 27S pre-rRNA processing Urb2/Npa2 C-terminal domain-containing protein n=1 Tax=Drosophila rubida TaxID=30044 RepID=A0AAD4KCP2_9MUSC|nr:hypothetical protein KR093_004526 [Drosophila rubida]
MFHAELKSWLKDKSKEYTARLQFAIKVWQSAEFSYINKYEVICEWLAKTLSKAPQLPSDELRQLFGLRAQPGLVSVQVKTDLIQVLHERINQQAKEMETIDEHAELLQSLLNFEPLQDVLRADYTLLMSTYGLLFASYERQLKQTTANKITDPAEFVLPLLQQLRDYVQRAQHYKPLLKAYTATALQPLCELLLQLRAKHAVCCFAHLAALEQQLTEQLEIAAAIQRLVELPLHVRLLVLEAALVNQRLDPINKPKLFRYAFEQRSGKDAKAALERLAIATHTLEALRKHNIELQFTLSEKTTVMEFLSERVFALVNECKHLQLRGVLMLLSAALRLNPLVLEPNVYQITIWMLTRPKRTDQELSLYAAYVVQLLDMFRRLGRTERFVMQLLKSLREWLRQYELKLPGSGDAKRSRLTEEPAEQAEELIDFNVYMELLFEPHSVATTAGTDRLVQSWPSATVGAAFTRLVSSLTAKQSIVIWKMLLHTFEELLQPQTQAVVRPANLNFAIELQVALLCQYLLGTRLAEHVAQHQAELLELRRHMSQVLQQFGRHLLAREHKRSTMNAFLECVERASSLELLLAYYWPDGLPKSEEQQLPQLQQFLPSDEWDLIRQRVHNFGKSLCRQRLQRLELQLAQAGWLLLPHQRHEPCPAALVELVPRQLLMHLSRAQKQQRCSQAEQREVLLDDAECVELLFMQLLQQYVDNLKAGKVKHTLICKQLSAAPEATLPAETALAALIRQNCEGGKQPALPLEATSELIEALQRLPLAQLVSSIKLRLWLLIFTLYLDVRRAQLPQQAEQLLEQLIDLLHFGQPLPICSHLPQLSELLQLVPIDDGDDDAAIAWRFYETLFERCIRRLTAGSDLFLASCAEHLRESALTLQPAQCRLLLLAIETLASATGAQARRMQRHLQPLLEIYGQFVGHKFRSLKKTPSDSVEFVQQTIAGFSIYLSSCINRAAKQQREEKQQLEEQKKLDEKEVNEDKEQQKKSKKDKKSQKKEKSEEDELEGDKTANDAAASLLAPIDESLRRICKIYIGHSLNYRNPHAIRLLNVALTYRQQLHLDQDEIEFLLDSYWRQLNADIEAATLDIDSIEAAIKLIIDYKTNEDFLLLLRRLITQLEAMQRPETESQHRSMQNVLILLQLCSKCTLSGIKGAMLNEHFELINGIVSLRLPSVGDANYGRHQLRLLEAQRALAANRTVPLTGETLDTLLGTMLDINIKRLISSGGQLNDLLQLHAAISENLLLLLRQHATLMSDRAAQLSTLCQDLLEAIICYRGDRKQAHSLSIEELDALSELALKLVTLLAGIAAGPQALAIKRVAPFLLISAIKQMVTTERSTTLFPQIKVHMDRICHELIGLCDHRAGHFILRSSSEAGARLYQDLVKEHDKFHKFRGKV